MALKVLGVAANVIEKIIQVKKRRSAEDYAERRKMAKADPVGYFRQFSKRVSNDASETDNRVRGDRASPD